VLKQEGQSVLEATQTATLADKSYSRWYRQCSKWKAVNRDIAANLDEQKNKLTVLQRKIMQE
jgi:hypothetical protein